MSAKDIKRAFLVLLAAMLTPMLSMAQETITTQPNSIPVEIMEETARRERAYEVPIRNALSEYFAKGTYIVDVKLELKESLLAKGFRKPTGQELAETDLESLPGLPMVPQNMVRQNRAGGVSRDTLLPTSFDRVYVISNIRVNVMLDAEYGEEEVSFTKALITSVAKLNEFRGDVVIVDKRPFPKKKSEKELAQSELDKNAESNEAGIDENALVPPPETIITNQSGQPGAESDLPTTEEPQDLLAQILANPVYSLLAGLLLLVLIMLIIVLFRMNSQTSRVERIERFERVEGKSNSENGERENQRNGAQKPAPGTEDANVAQLKEVIEEFKQQLLAPIIEDNKKIEKIEAPTDEAIARFETDKSYIISQCLSNVESVASVLIEWMESDQEQGPVRAAQAIASINPKLVNTLKSALGVEYFHYLESVLDDMEPLDIREKIKIARAFTHGVKQTKAGQAAKGTYSDMFGFMGQLTDDQVLHLLKEEDDDIAAIALAQLGSERINRLLKMFDIDKRVVLLTKMGKITSLPVSSYKDIATQLARRALEVSNMKYVVADGIQSIISVIDSMPIAEQDDYLDKIALTDIELVKKVRSMFVSFADIPNLSDDQLQEPVANVDKQVLVYALHEAPEETIEKLLSLRGSRERMIIENDIENLGKVDPQQVEEARRDLLLAIRQSMKGQPA